MASYTARHAAASKSNVLRNTGIAAAASAVVLGSVAPANAFASAAPAATSQTVTYQSSGYTTYQAAETTSTTTTQASSTEALAQQATGSRAEVVSTALDGQGGAYVWGGKSYKAWDCSGFVSYVLKQHGVNVTAYTKAMENELRPTSTPQPGDVVFTNGYNHVGIYLGNGQMISALNPSQGTQVTSVDGGGYMPVDGYYTIGL